ncbi:hypothetical protein Ahy_A05g024768 isoform B [Arachis hypogaea]|uniref:Replication protein A 70 kDa DNA-binding subunit B/D first OB fold domain-containing protein n=1 Tax=Arachis hypogaea TaxID=3818 RepID=A0A445D711_ARAHY|nr:hypothetical protein Ahy_A05g024768 isoform B [Arachis hypogaea]
MRSKWRVPLMTLKMRNKREVDMWLSLSLIFLVVRVARLYEFPHQWNKNVGGRIHVTICKSALELFNNRIKEHAVYSMQNFIAKFNNGKVRKTPHKYKSSQVKT